MAARKVCDACGKVTEKIALKLYKAPKSNPKTDHNSYTHHANIGVCCVMEINKIHWNVREKRGSAKTP